MHTQPRSYYFFLNMLRSRALCLAALAPDRLPSLASSFMTSPKLPCKRLIPAVSATPNASGTHIGGRSLLTISPTCNQVMTKTTARRHERSGFKRHLESVRSAGWQQQGLGLLVETISAFPSRRCVVRDQRCHSSAGLTTEKTAQTSHRNVCVASGGRRGGEKTNRATNACTRSLCEKGRALFPRQQN